MILNNNTIVLFIIIISLLATLVYGIVLFMNYKKYVFAQIYFFSLICFLLSYLYDIVLFAFIPDFDWYKILVSDISDIGYYLLIILMYKLMAKTIIKKTNAIKIFNDKKISVWSTVIVVIIILLIVGCAISVNYGQMSYLSLIIIPFFSYALFLNVRMILYKNKEINYFDCFRMFNIVLFLLLIWIVILYAFEMTDILYFNLLLIPLSISTMFLLREGIKKWI